MRHLSQVVPDAPVLGDLAAGQPEPVDVLDAETLVRRGNPGCGGGGEWQGVQSYFEPVVAPERGRRRIVVMDNLSVHKSERVERSIEEVEQDTPISSVLPA